MYRRERSKDMNTSKRMKYADELNTNGIDTLSAYVHGQAERIGNETQTQSTHVLKGIFHTLYEP